MMDLPVSLYSRHLGHPDGKPLIILHGLLGTADNWHTLGKAYGESHQVWLVDQRNHGRSPHHSSHDYTDLASDLLQFLDDRGLFQVNILGHSMGGKTALMFAHLHPERVDRLIIADIAARSYKPHHQPIFDAIQTAPIEGASSRSSIEAHLSKNLKDPAMVGFLMKNLRRDRDQGLIWRPNISALNSSVSAVVKDVPLETNTIPTLLIYGGKSDYVSPSDQEQFESQCLVLETHCIEEAGHWLHASHPEEFFDVTIKFLKE